MFVQFKDNKLNTDKLNSEAILFFWNIIGQYEYCLEHDIKIDYNNIGLEFDKKLKYLIDLGLIEKVIEI